MSLFCGWRSNRLTHLLCLLIFAFISDPAFAQNADPTDIALSSQSVAENQAAGTAVGTFSTTDEDSVER